MKPKAQISRRRYPKTIDSCLRSPTWHVVGDAAALVHQRLRFVAKQAVGQRVVGGVRVLQRQLVLLVAVPLLRAEAGLGASWNTHSQTWLSLE